MECQAQGEVNDYRVPRLSAWLGDEPEQLVAGTHVIAYRRGYTHHGIYLGGGRVVH